MTSYLCILGLHRWRRCGPLRWCRDCLAMQVWVRPVRERPGPAAPEGSAPEGRTPQGQAKP